jgi:hypothetical protein
MLPVYRFVETLGLAALNMAFLGAASLAFVIAANLFQRDLRERVAALAIGSAALANLGLGALLAIAPASTVMMLYALTMIVAVIAIAAVWQPTTAARLTINLIALAQIVALYHLLSQASAGFGLDLPGQGTPSFLAEALALAATLALPLSFHVRPHRWHLALGLVLALLFFAAHLARPWTVATMTMWTISFTLFLPGVLYAIALGVWVTMLLALRREPQTRPIATGLFVIGLAGLKPDFTYFALLGLVGLLIAARQVSRDMTVPSTPLPKAELIASYPHLQPVLDGLGLDTCCGGHMTVTDAAAEHGMDVAAVVVALRRALAAGES